MIYVESGKPADRSDLAGFFLFAVISLVWFYKYNLYNIIYSMYQFYTS